MRTSSLANVSARYTWLLHKVKTGEKTAPEHAQALGSVRLFCELEIAGKFSKISLNTLKSVTKAGLIPNIYAPAYPSQWEYFLDLMAEARTNAVAQQHTGKNSGNSAIEISPEEKFKQAHLHAHLCSLAFTDLFSMISNFLNTQNDLSEIAHARLKRQLDISSTRFKHLHSPTKLQSGLIKLVED